MERQTSTGMRGTSSSACGIVSGYLLKVLRESTGLTQAAFAERVGVDVSTAQGWESGRRPLTNLRTLDLMELRLALLGLSAPVNAVSQFDDAAMADLVIGTAIEMGDQPIEDRPHPLAQLVHRRSLSTMITWPITGARPDSLGDLPATPRRGPVPDRPVLDPDLQTRFFDHMLTVVESSDPSRTLLRRQAMFLLGFDTRASSVEFLNQSRNGALRRSSDPDIGSSILVRSGAMALARRGNLDPVRSYIDGPLTKEEQHVLGNLNYWGYWVGEVGGTFSDDASLAHAPLHSWSGSRLLLHLLDHLADEGYSDMNIHSLSDLILARPGLLDQPELRARTEQSVAHALDSHWPERVREELVGVQYAIRMASR